MTDALTQQLLLDAPLHAQAGALQRQLQQRLKDAILHGQLPAGARLPATRQLAAALAISRNTVSFAYEHLAAEGYLVADRQGTRVAALHLRPAPAAPAQATATPRLAQRTTRLAATSRANGPYLALRAGQPALSHFPMAAWRRALERALRTGPETLAYGDPAGEMALRTSLARYLGVARGVRCTPQQIFITEGTQQALALCVRLLADPGEAAWVEDPGYRGAKTAFHAADLRVIAKPVDHEGLALTAADWQAPPRMIYVTPSHQYPVGGVMPAARRLDLIAQARRHQCWIIEDDYDSEFRHHGEPIAAMQGMTPDAPVLYVGSFSKTMFPALRVGFLVLPASLAEVCQTPAAELLRGGQRHQQLALADFIENGEFSRHLGRMRRLYRERQQALRQALAQRFDVEHEVLGGQSGLHLTVRLPERYDDRRIASSAPAYGMQPQALSTFSLASPDNGLVLGYGNTASERFETLAATLARLARQARQASR
ncbi:DNA-binding protein [Bordetella trematum]|uniref:GntR family transcriptional regulator n=1 Tax=Bordetella trematum TaxID=123899 RepID=A0A157QPY4_9BORD|nr:PLP-dependent aminotransferase family protein [Bordetella trematum]AZR93850.1 DNA-binding protein [Bordetella trematum]NNH18976.1 PLP-dependent aminotransferase family protein [Bordetella trematum]SAI47797.1 GntR family transcriptional regulator [Bordetella trematum]SAI72034.1 GntR family transcriptional regulator [Bordetella trematum]SUV98009.1 GntR family transcriptional regulator [Bordetella trematum]